MYPSVKTVMKNLRLVNLKRSVLIRFPGVFEETFD